MKQHNVATHRHTSPAELLRIQRDLGLQLSGATGLKDALGQVLAACLRVDGFDCGGIYLVDGSTQAVDLAAVQGLSASFVASVSHFDRTAPQAQLVAAGKPVYVACDELAPSNDPVWENEGLRGSAVIPISHDGRVIADLNLSSRVYDHIPEEVRHTVEAIAAQIGGVIARLRAEEARNQAAEELDAYRDKLEQLVRERTAELMEANRRLLTENQERVRVEAALRRSQQELQARSLHDELTDLHNRRGFMLLAEQQIELAERSDIGLWLLFADLDSLKWINDELGHAEGDQALIDAADILRNTFRGSDVVARFAGDEFAVLAAETSPLDTALISHRLQTEVDNFNNTVSRPYRLSLSWGISYRPPGSSVNLDNMIREADRRMYETKRQAKGI